MSVTINGTNGLTFNDNSTQTTAATGFGFKNRIINGAMVIDQRNAGASFTSSGLFYCVDRWMLQAVGANNSAQQVIGSTGNNKAVRITGGSGNTLTGFSQRIEAANIYDCASQTITVSFTLFGSASGSVSVRFLYPTATDNYTSTTEPVAGTTVNFTTTATQYSVTRTLDSNANKGVWVYFDFGAVGAGVTRTIEFVQLEKGSTATSFDYRPYGTELSLCQRYFQRIGDGGNPYAVLGVGRFGSSTAASVRFPWSVPMRTTPSGSFNTATYAFWEGTTARSVGAISFYSAGTDGVEGDIATTSATNGAMTQLRGNAGSPNAPYINLSAEL